MCEKPATSDEHAPPRCIFPELKDVSDATNRRENLITVPSCDEHNSVKSKDDEYLLYILSLSITSNSVGHTQANSKVKRAIARKPNLLSKFNQNATQIPFTNFNNGNKSDAIATLIDGDRINSALDKCARALYFHTTGQKFIGIAKVINGFLLSSQENSENKVEIFEQTKNIFNHYQYLGNNQDTFKYKIIDVNESAMLLLEFYDTSKAIVDLRSNCAAK